MQYTIRGVPSAVDSALRERARVARKSLNEAVIDALTAGAGVTGAPAKQRDLGDIAGTWRPERAVTHALRAQDHIDEDLWE